MATRSRKPPTYGISSEGVLVPSKEHPLISWTHLATYTIDRNPRVPQVRMLFLHRNSGIVKQIPLPGGDVETRILAALADRLPQRPPPPWASPLKRSDWLLALTLTGAFVVGGSLYIGRHVPNIHGSSIADVILLGSLLAGPGTWMALLLRKRRASEQLIALCLRAQHDLDGDDNDGRPHCRFAMRLQERICPLI